MNTILAWVLVASQGVTVSDQGDPSLSNGRLSAVLSRKDASVQLSAPGGARARLVFLGSGGEPAASVRSVTVSEGGKGAASLDVVCTSAKGGELAVKLRLKRGDVSLECTPGEGAVKLRVECPSRFAVLPDFFADDIVIDAAKIPLAAAEVPGDNFLLHLAGKGDALGFCVFESREQDVRLTLDRGAISGSEIAFGKGKRIWVALLEAPGIWHAIDVKKGNGKETLPLEWKMPFPAQWRVDFTRTDDLIDSWEMLLPDRKGSGFVKPSWLGQGSEKVKADRKRWAPVLGSFRYPCWSDAEGKSHLQPLNHESLAFAGPAVIYPINRVPETPLDSFTVVDVMRNSLGVGPCEYILDLEGQKGVYKGFGTCDTRDALNAIYGKGEQKAKRKEIEKLLGDVHVFVTHIRSRITHYKESARKAREYLAEQAKARPELRDSIAALEKIAAEIDVRYAAREAKIRTPDHVKAVCDEFRKRVLDAEGPEALAQCKRLTAAMVEVGDNQDELVGECRWVVRTLRQRAGTLMALDPRLAPVAAEVRSRCQEALRNPASYEHPRY